MGRRLSQHKAALASTTTLTSGSSRAFDQHERVVNRGAAPEGPEGRSPHFGPRVSRESLEAIFLTDELFPIADFDGIDDGLLDRFDLNALGVLEFGEELVDRRVDFANFDPIPVVCTAAKFLGSPRPPIIRPPPSLGSGRPTNFDVARDKKRMANAVSAGMPHSPSKWPSRAAI